VGRSDAGCRKILSAPRFSQVVVAETGHMAVMNTMNPLTVVEINRMISNAPARDPKNASRARCKPIWLRDWCGRACINISGQA
jgi:hypothetical protein